MLPVACTVVDLLAGGHQLVGIQLLEGAGEVRLVRLWRLVF